MPNIWPPVTAIELRQRKIFNPEKRPFLCFKAPFWSCTLFGEKKIHNPKVHSLYCLAYLDFWRYCLSMQDVQKTEILNEL